MVGGFSCKQYWLVGFQYWSSKCSFFFISNYLFLCPQPTQPHAVSMSTVHSVSYNFYVHYPLSLVLFLCPLPTQSRAVSLSTTHSVSCCLYTHYPLSLVLCICPLPTHSCAVSLFIAHSVSCYFCIGLPIMFKERCTVARKSRSSGWHSYLVFMRPQL